MERNREIETLESRRLLSSAAISHHSLRVSGDDNVDDNIALAVNGDSVFVSLDGAAAQQFALADFKKIVVYGKSGNDTITIDDASGGLGKIRVWINAGDGNDSISTGLENDVVRCGAGDDSLHDVGGRNWVDGGAGNDDLVTGDGNDVVFAGAGDDHIDGFNGNNWLFGGAGNDRIEAGEGRDVMDGGAGDDSLHSLAGNDVLYGGRGNDTLDAGDGDDRLVDLSGTNDFQAGAGNDTLVGRSSKSSLDGGDGTNRIVDLDNLDISSWWKGH